MNANGEKPKAIARSHDGHFVVVHSQQSMVNELAEIQRASFPDLAQDELMLPEHYQQHIARFPEGQHAVLEKKTGRVVACSSDLRVFVNFSHYQHSYMEAVGNNTFSTHKPDGDWLYGADIGVHPDFRGFRLSSLLYGVRQNLVKTLGLRGHVAGAMPKGYGHHATEMAIEKYVQQVVRHEISDPVLSVQLRRGYCVYGIIPDYLDDPSCHNHGVFIVWRNPEVRW